MLFGIGNCKVQYWVGVFLVSDPNLTFSSSRSFHCVFAVAMLAQLEGPDLNEDVTLFPGISSKSAFARVPQSE